MAIRFHLPALSFLDSNGDPFNGGRLYFYESGTTTPLDTYSDEDLTTVSPMTAGSVRSDSSGRFGDIWLKAQAYKVILKDSADVTVTTMDAINGSLVVSGDDFKASSQDPEDMTVLVAVGSFWDMQNKQIVSKEAQTSSVITAPAANPRKDIIHANRITGIIGVTTGAEAGIPSDPTLADGLLPIARVTLATTTTEITDSLITDIRELEQLGWGETDGGVRLTDTDAGANSGPILDLYRNSASPLADDFIGLVRFSGETSTGAKITYAQIYPQLLDPTNGSEDSRISFRTLLAGASNDVLRLEAGAQIGTPTGGDKGAGTLNATALYEDGVQILPLTLSTMVDATNGGADDLTVIDFTGIAATVKRITVLFDSLSFNSADDLLIQIGDSGGLEATNYVSAGGDVVGATASSASSTTGFIASFGAAGRSFSGTMTIVLMDASTNLWAESHSFGRDDAGATFGGGQKALSAALDRLSITTTGAGTFDGGNVNIMVE